MPLTPCDVIAGSRKKVWWQYAEEHMWKAAVYTHTGRQKSGCPVCAGRAKSVRQRRYGALMEHLASSGKHYIWDTAHKTNFYF
jgi:hypothetical protein